jgi:tRNA (guanine10-N2)-dimethyltransferase
MPVTSICILGRQPKLGLAELESVFGADKVRPVGSTTAQVDGDVHLKRFGGQLKTGTTLATLNTTDFDKLIDHMRKNLRGLLRDIPEGKIKLGLSFYDFNVSPSKINAAGLSLKKVVKSAGRSVRIAPNTEPALSTAQTMHNQLTSPVGIELMFVRDGDKTILARVTEVQDINDYTLRDRGRPKRDAFVGMLPPKLAQIMLNLAISDDKPRRGYTVLDPFCGTGVILQEALLMGYGAHGSDVDQRMVDYTSENIMEWLPSKYPEVWDVMPRGVSRGDATTTTWETLDVTFDENQEIIHEEEIPMPIDAVVCEGYLGQPMSQAPPREKLEEIIHECNSIMRDFLKNIAPQLKSGTRLCIGAPAWFVGGSTKHLPVLDDLENLGYNRIDFERANREDLIYHREDQIVGRELVVLTKE